MVGRKTAGPGRKPKEEHTQGGLESIATREVDGSWVVVRKWRLPQLYISLYSLHGSMTIPSLRRFISLIWWSVFQKHIWTNTTTVVREFEVLYTKSYEIPLQHKLWNRLLYQNWPFDRIFQVTHFAWWLPFIPLLKSLSRRWINILIRKQLLSMYYVDPLAIFHFHIPSHDIHMI